MSSFDASSKVEVLWVGVWDSGGEEIEGLGENGKLLFISLGSDVIGSDRLSKLKQSMGQSFDNTAKCRTLPSTAEAFPCPVCTFTR